MNKTTINLTAAEIRAILAGKPIPDTVREQMANALDYLSQDWVLARAGMMPEPAARTPGGEE